MVKRKSRNSPVGEMSGSQSAAGESPEKVSPPPKASRLTSDVAPPPNIPSFSSSMQLSSFIADHLQEKLSSLSPSLQTVVECVSSVIFSYNLDINSFIQQVTEQGSEIKELVEENTLLKSQLLNQTQELQSLREEVKQLNDNISDQNNRFIKLESYVDSLDSYIRRETVIISSEDIPSETSDENCTKLAIDLVKSKLNYEIKSEDISIAHRLGKKLPDKKRPLIVKLTRRSIKHQMVRKCVQKRPLKFGINESLSPLRRSIFNTLRAVKKDYNDIQQLHTNDGTIIMKLNSTGETYHKITDATSLDIFLQKHPALQEMYKSKKTNQ